MSLPTLLIHLCEDTSHTLLSVIVHTVASHIVHLQNPSLYVTHFQHASIRPDCTLQILQVSVKNVVPGSNCKSYATTVAHCT